MGFFHAGGLFGSAQGSLFAGLLRADSFLLSAQMKRTAQGGPVWEIFSPISILPNGDNSQAGLRGFFALEREGAGRD